MSRRSATSFPNRTDFYNQISATDAAMFDEHPGIPQRPPASAHLMIDSLDRFSNNYAVTLGANAGLYPANDMEIQSSQALLYGYFTRVAITQVNLRYNVPTVVTGKNDLVTFTDICGAQTSATWTIPQGFYDASGLIDAMNSFFTTTGGVFAGYTASWNNLTKGITVKTNNDHIFFLQPPIVLPAGSQRARANYLLGISNLNGPTAIGGSPASTQNLSPPRLYYTNFVDICSANLTKYQRVKDAESSSAPGLGNAINLPAAANIIARVYLIAPNTRIQGAKDNTGVAPAPIDLVVDYNTPKHIRWSPNEAIYSLDFQLRDQFGDLLPWTPANPTEFMLTCVASET